MQDFLAKIGVMCYIARKDYVGTLDTSGTPKKGETKKGIRGYDAMASVNWVKMKSVQQVKAVLRHDCKDTRQDAKTHTNEALDKTLTGQNYGVGDTYDEAQKAFTERLATVTAGKTVRKDAVVGVGFSIPAPADLSADKEKDWFGRVYDVLKDKYGEDNICCFAVHVDEQHEYIDPDTKESKMSRSHAQGVMVPEVNGKLCAKDFVSRARMIEINNAIDEMSQKEFGVQFMDGSKRKSRGSVETMKQRSAREKIEKEIAEARKDAEAARAEADAEEDILRVIAAARALRSKDGNSIYDNLLTEYKARPKVIPRIPADAARIQARNAARTAALEAQAEEITGYNRTQREKELE